MNDRYSELLEQEIKVAEYAKENRISQESHNIYIGKIAAFKAALACYRMFKEDELKEENEKS